MGRDWGAHFDHAPNERAVRPGAGLECWPLRRRHLVSPASPPGLFAGPDAPDETELYKCVHCGFCLQACPDLCRDRPGDRVPTGQDRLDESRQRGTAGGHAGSGPALGPLHPVPGLRGRLSFRRPVREADRGHIEPCRGPSQVRHHRRSNIEALFQAPFAQAAQVDVPGRSSPGPTSGWVFSTS